jgi:Amt family ammonium transporter
VLLYSFVIAFILGFVINKTVGFRLDREDEETGVDLVEHAESAYETVPTGGFRPGGALAGATRTNESNQEVPA